jgi:hypothetical protein
MTREEAIEILEEVKEIDDSMYQYNSKYMEVLDMAITLLRNEPDVDNPTDNENEIKVGNVFILDSEYGKQYEVVIININDCRDPRTKYACDVYLDGVCINDDYIFIGDDFFKLKNVRRKY